MSGSICSFGKTFFVAGFLVCVMVVSAAAQGALQVGDVVEIESFGDKYEGTITKFVGTGWPYVKYERRGRTMERPFPPSKVRLVRSVGGAAPMKAESREWVDATGKFKIQGKLISNENGSVEIEKSDGRVIKLPIAKLSSKDQAYLKESEAEKSSDNPFAGGEMRGASKRGASGGSRGARGSAAGITGVPASTTAITPAATAREIVLRARSWSYEPTPAPAATPSSRTISFNTTLTKHSFHNRSPGAHVSLDKKTYATAIGNAFEGDSEIIFVDLEKGSATPPKRIAIKQASMLGVSPNGDYAATARSGRGGSKGTVDFWRLDDTLKHVAAWTAGGSRSNFSPSQGRFLDPTRLLTVGKRLVLWDIKSATAIYSAEVSSAVKPAFSPSGKEIAVGKGTMIHLVDIESGNSLGQFLPPPNATIVAFSQSGRFLAGLAPRFASIWVWDLQTNELAQELSGPQISSSMQWVGDKYLLINGSLIDVELRVPLWQYNTTGGNIVDSQDGRQWFAGKNKLVPIDLPHRDFDAETANLDPDSLLIFKPGTEVAFDFRLPFQPTEQKKIRDKFSDMLQKNGVTVNQSGSLRLVATVTKQKQETKTMSDFFSGPFARGGQKVTYTPHLASLSLEQDGKVLWSKKQRFAPGGVVSLNQGESAQQAVNRVSQPRSSFFTSAVMPKHLAVLPGGKPLGSSTINESGVN